MPIYTDKILMDVHRMIRKGSVQFEPEDRIPLVFSNKGKEMTLYLGSVYYDSTQCKVCYDLYNHKDSVWPVGTLNPREIEKLSAGDLVAVADRLEDYEKMSILRHENYYAIERAIGESPDLKVEFEDITRPRVLVPADSRFDQHEGFIECRVHSVFKDRISNNCYAAVKDGQGNGFNVKLPMLNDRSIMNISSCLKSLQTKRQDVTQQNPKGVPF